MSVAEESDLMVLALDVETEEGVTGRPVKFSEYTAGMTHVWVTDPDGTCHYLPVAEAEAQMRERAAKSQAPSL